MGNVVMATSPPSGGSGPGRDRFSGETGHVGAAGIASGKPVGVCGEAAADPLLAVVLVGLGVNTLSMSPAALADVRAELKLHTVEEARSIAAAALTAATATQAREAAQGAAQKS